MAGYPPQQHYAAPPPQPGPYGPPPPGYPMHHGGPPMHHGYPPPMPPPGAGGPYQSPYPPGAGPSGGPWADSHFDHHPPPPPGSMHGPPPPQQQQPPPPPPQSQQQPPQSQPGPPSLARPGGYGSANGLSQGPHPQPNQGNVPPPHPQNMQHQGQPPYGVMPPRDYPPPPRPGPSQSGPQMGPGGPPPPPQPQQGQGQQPRQQQQQGHPHGFSPSTPRPSASAKRGNAGSSSRDKERGTGSGVNTGKSGGQRRTQQDKQASGKGGRSEAANAKAEAAAARAEAAAAAAAAQDEPVQESKKIRKRKEVVDRIHRVHWDTVDNRDLLYNEMQHSLAQTGSVLLLSPALSRPYLLALHRLTLERDAQLRQIALLHAHQVESARTAFDQDRNKVEDEAKSAKKAVRERLLAAVEDRRKRLREDKEGGEGTSDALLDPSSRAHATRKLRNKGPGASRRGDGLEPEGSLSLRGKSSNTANGASNGTLGLSFSGGGGSGSDGDGSSTPKGGAGNGNNAETAAHPLLSSLLELTGLAGSNGHVTSLPPSNFDALTTGAANATLLHLGVGGGMGDSSYMASLRANAQSHGKGKKKTSASNKTTVNGVSTGVAGGGAAIESGVLASGEEEDEDSNSRSMAAAAAAAAAVAAATMVNGTGRLRWDQGKSVGQLTSAKDIEIESDLINIRKVGNKRRRR